MKTLRHPSQFASGLLAALPIVLGYLPIAFSFGVAATKAGLSPQEAILFSVVMYSGAAQFLAIALLTSGAPVFVSILTLIAMGVRHVLYGPALLKKAGEDAPTNHAWAWAFGLTDEVFASALGALSRGSTYSEAFMFGLALGAYGAWVVGTILGAFAGAGTFKDWPVMDAALGFILPALFLALLLSILRRDMVLVVMTAVVVTFGMSHVFSTAIALLLGMVGGGLVGVFARGGPAHDPD